MKNPFPWPYYITHALVAVLIDAATWGAVGQPLGLGGLYYAAREVWQYAAQPGPAQFFSALRDTWRRRGLAYFDWPGFWWPVVASAALTLGV